MTTDCSIYFSENLRKFRKKMNLTQQSLGDLIGYTEKAVSKWESGASVPPIETLILLSDILNVSLDELVSRPSKPEYYLGIDGSANKTTFALGDRNGRILQKIVLGPSNPFDIGISGATAVIDEGIKLITSGINKRKISMFAGLSGGGAHETKEMIRAHLAGLGFLKTDNGSDSANIISAGLGNDDGAVVVMSTGSACFIKKGDAPHTRIGGFGYLFDHGGSGYDLGNAAIRAALCAEDGSGEKTLILDHMLKALKTRSVNENIFNFYSMGKVGIASYAPVIFDAYTDGDKLAENILRRNMERVAELIITASKRFDDTDKKVKIVCVGGLTKQADILFPMLYSEIEKIGDINRFDISVFDNDVVVGALINAGMPV